jgi:protein-disulfide isomerase
MILRRLLVSLVVMSSLLAQSLFAQSQPSQSAKSQAAPTLINREGLPSEETVNAFLFQMLGYDPSITWKVTDIRPSELAGLAEVTFIVTTSQGTNQNRLLVSADGKHAIQGEILPFGAHPFEEAQTKLEKGVNGPARGPAKAPVTIVEFSDMQCPHCQKAAPTIDQLLAQEPNVHFVFQNFPLPSHNWAEKAARYVDCAGRVSENGNSNDAVWKFIQKTFEEQANITAANLDEKVKTLATASGVNGDDLAACAAKPETKERIEASVALGKSVGVSGTPALFINGQSVGAGAPIDLLKKIVDFKISQAKTDK